MFMAPANSIKLNMEPKSNSEKSKLLIKRVASLKMGGYKFPVINKATEVTRAMNIKPMEGGSFKYLKLMYAKIADSTIKKEKVWYKLMYVGNCYKIK